MGSVPLTAGSHACLCFHHCQVGVQCTHRRRTPRRHPAGGHKVQLREVVGMTSQGRLAMLHSTANKQLAMECQSSYMQGRCAFIYICLHTWLKCMSPMLRLAPSTKTGK